MHTCPTTLADALLLLASGDAGDRQVILDVLFVLAAAALVTLPLRRLKLATIPGYLITGALIGKSAFGIIRSDDNVSSINSLAIILLMFTIGLHLDLAALRRGLAGLLAAGAISTILVVMLGWPTAMAFGLAPAPALVLAMAVSMSSTAVVLRLLAQRRETHRMHGRLCVGIAIVQDMLALVMLAVLPALAKWNGTAPADAANHVMTAWTILQGAAIKLGGIAALIGFGVYVLPLLMKEASREASGESTLVLAAAVALGAAVVTGGLGFSPELGAFLAGFLLAATPFRYQLAGQLSPMRDLFLAVFFTTVGLQMNLGAVVEGWWLLLLGLVALVVIKVVAIAITTWACGATAPVALRTAFSLAQAGEFSIVILGVAVGPSFGIFTTESLALPIALVVLSLIITPSLYDLGERLAPRLNAFPPARWLTTSHLREAPVPVQEAGAPVGGDGPGPGSEGQPAPGAKHAPTGPHAPKSAIIAGFGIVGRAVADHLEVHGVPYTVVEINAATIFTQRNLGRRVVFGDIANPEVLESAGVHDADAVFLTIPDDEATLRACQTIRRLAPHAFIVARAAFLSTAFQAAASGADDVAVAEVATAEAMAKKVLARLKKA